MDIPITPSPDLPPILLYHETTLPERLQRVSNILYLQSNEISIDSLSPSSISNVQTSLSSSSSSSSTTEYRGLYAVNDIPAGTILFNEIPLLYMSGKTQKDILFAAKVYDYQHQHQQQQYKKNYTTVSSSSSSSSGILNISNPSDILSILAELDIQITNKVWTTDILLKALSYLQPYPTTNNNDSHTNTNIPELLTLSRMAKIIKTNAAEAAFTSYSDIKNRLLSSSTSTQLPAIINESTPNVSNPHSTPTTDSFSDPANGISCLLLLFSMFNHSCLPNVSWISQWNNELHVPMFQLYTLKSIKKNEELYLSYIPESLSQYERKLDLWNRYNFQCQCPRCQLPYDDTRALVCMECSAPVYMNSISCSICHTVWINYIMMDKERWEPESISLLLNEYKRYKEKDGKYYRKPMILSDTNPTTLSDSDIDIGLLQKLLLSYYNDIQWYLRDEINLSTITCASARLHPFDHQFFTTLCEIRNKSIDYIISNSTYPNTAKNGIAIPELFTLSTRTLWHISEVCVYSITNDNVQQYNWHRPQEIMDILLCSIEIIVLYSIDNSLYLDRQLRNKYDLPWHDFTIDTMAQDSYSLWKFALQRYNHIKELYIRYQVCLWNDQLHKETLKILLSSIDLYLQSLLKSTDRKDTISSEDINQLYAQMDKQEIFHQIKQWKQQRQLLN